MGVNADRKNFEEWGGGVYFKNIRDVGEEW